MKKHSIFEWCCLKMICNGCDLAVEKRGMFDCAFCRTPYPKDDAHRLAMIHARVAKKDPDAINFLGHKYYQGDLGLQKDKRKAVELWTEAAELGSVHAFFNLGVDHYYGRGVQQDMAKAIHFHEKAAMQGHVDSRHILGCIEGQEGNYDRAVRHHLISAKMGDEDSLGTIKRAFMDGIASKEQYAEALRGYQQAVEEIKSNDRVEATRLDTRRRRLHHRRLEDKK